jgi:hypothetical protein
MAYKLSDDDKSKLERAQAALAEQEEKQPAPTPQPVENKPVYKIAPTDQNFSQVAPSIKRLTEKYYPEWLDDLKTDEDWHDYYQRWNRQLDTNTYFMGAQLKDSLMQYDDKDKADLAAMRAAWKNEPTVFERASKGDWSGALEGAGENLGWGALDPVNFVPMLKGAGMFARVLANMGIDAVASYGMDVAEQKIEKDAGLRSEIDHKEAAITGAVGGVISGAGQGTARLLGKGAKMLTSDRWDKQIQDKIAKEVDKNMPTYKIEADTYNSSLGYGVEEKEYAASINLKRQHASDRIKSMELGLAELHDEFKPARRTGVNVEDGVKTLLGMGAGTPDNLGRNVGQDPNIWRPGMALNAEELGAARVRTLKVAQSAVQDLMNAAKTNDPADWAVAVANMRGFRKQVEFLSGASSEAGRSLGQMRRIVDEDGYLSENSMNNLFRIAGVTDKSGKLDTGRLQSLAEKLSLYDANNPASLEKIAQTLYSFQKDPKSNRWLEVYYNSLLSNPSLFMPVTGVNFMSNVATQALAFPEMMVASAIGAVRGGQDRIFAKEIAGRAVGTLHGLMDGLRAAGTVIKDGPGAVGTTKLDVDVNKIPGVAGRLINAPSTLLTAADEFFKATARRAELYQMAYHDAIKKGVTGPSFSQHVDNLVNNPTRAMLTKANAAAKYYTYQSDVGTIGKSLQSFKAAHPVIGAATVPFVRTPINIMRYAIERTPGISRMLQSTKDALNHGGAAADMARARVYVGTMGLMAASTMATMGMITGAEPKDPVALQKWRDEKKQAYSIRIGDKWYQYNRLDPFGTILGWGADMVTLTERGLSSDDEEVWGAAFGVFTQTFVNKTWLSGIVRIMDAVANPEGGGKVDRLMSGLLSPVVPSGVAAWARAGDPVIRDVNGVSEAIMNRIPDKAEGYGRKNLYPKLDSMGNPLKTASPLDTKEGTLADQIARLMSPGAVTDAVQDHPVLKAMNELEITKQVRAPTFRKGDFADAKSTPQQEYYYNYYRGKTAERILMPLVIDPRWKDTPVELRKKAIGDAFETAGKYANGVVKEMFPDINKRLAHDHKRESEAVKNPDPTLTYTFLRKMFGWEEDPR